MGTVYKLSPMGRAGAALDAATIKAKKAKLATTSADLERLYPTPPEEQNGESAFRNAIAVYRAFKSQKNETATKILSQGLDPATKKQYTNDRVDIAVTEAAPIFQAISVAAQSRHLHWKRDWDKGSMVLFPEFADCKFFAKCLSQRAESRARHGDTLGALSDIHDVFRLSRLIGEEPVLIADLVRIAMESIGFRSLGIVLNLAVIDDRVIASMKRIATDFREPKASPDFIRFEAYMMQSTFTRLKNPEDLVTLFGAGGNDNQSVDIWTKLACRTPGMITLVRAKVLETQADQVMDWEAGASKPFADQAARNKAFEAKLESETGVASKLASMFFPVYSQFAEARYKSKAHRECFFALVDAVTLAHPATFADLTVPLETSAAHSDPFSGGKILSVRDAQGLKVYSTGSDLTDDSGSLYMDRAMNKKATDVGILVGKPPKVN